MSWPNSSSRSQRSRSTANSSLVGDERHQVAVLGPCERARQPRRASSDRRVGRRGIGRGESDGRSPARPDRGRGRSGGTNRIQRLGRPGRGRAGRADRSARFALTRSTEDDRRGGCCYSHGDFDPAFARTRSEPAGLRVSGWDVPIGRVRLDHPGGEFLHEGRRERLNQRLFDLCERSARGVVAGHVLPTFVRVRYTTRTTMLLVFLSSAAVRSRRVTAATWLFSRFATASRRVLSESVRRIWICLGSVATVPTPFRLNAKERRNYRK